MRKQKAKQRAIRQRDALGGHELDAQKESGAQREIYKKNTLSLEQGKPKCDVRRIIKSINKNLDGKQNQTAENANATATENWSSLQERKSRTKRNVKQQ